MATTHSAQNGAADSDVTAEMALKAAHSSRIPMISTIQPHVFRLVIR
jgi:hypothetical protein